MYIHHLELLSMEIIIILKTSFTQKLEAKIKMQFLYLHHLDHLYMELKIYSIQNLEVQTLMMMFKFNQSQKNMDKQFKESISSTVKPEAIIQIKMYKYKSNLKNLDKDLIFCIKRLEAQMLVMMFKFKHYLKNMEIIMVTRCNFLFDIFIFTKIFKTLLFYIF